MKSLRISRHLGQACLFLGAALTCLPIIARGEEESEAERTAKLATQLREASPNVFSEEARERSKARCSEWLRAGLRQANESSSIHWRNVLSREVDEARRKEWEKTARGAQTLMRSNLLSPKTEALTAWPEPPENMETHVTKTIRGDGFFIDNIVFQSRPGWWVTANLYRPEKPTPKMPGIIISHSHHTPKEHGELQDMGMTCARAGCVVLVPDHLGHGERAQHGFHTAGDSPREFRLSRQDYYFRYDSSIQLYLAGDSLMGWMAWDLMRGVDLLLAHEGVDEDKIILLGAVAGGGDPCAVTAALDGRIDCAVPFNFGGPQPETRYPLPEDIETSFNYAGSGSWESTRNLIGSADGEFLPWMIVGSIAPRRLIYAHEFSWHRERDPVWKRLEKIYDLYDARDNLAFTHGRGELRGSSPEATHCTHIGKFHRAKIHEALIQWYGIEAVEYSNRQESRELKCWTGELRAKFKPRMLHEILQEQTAGQLRLRRRELAKLTPHERRAEIKRRWDFGDEVAEYTSDVVSETGLAGGAKMLRIRVTMEDSQAPREFPMLLLLPKTERGQKAPLVMAASQAGKAAFLKHRSSEIAALLRGGVAVCLVDVVGIGEIRLGDGRTRTSGDTSRAATALMLDRPLLMQREADFLLATLCACQHPEIDGEKVAFWGDSFSPINPPDAMFASPRGIGGRPHQVEPLGEMLALMGGIRHEAPVYIHHGLASYEDVLSSPYVYLPLDAIDPQMFFRGDISDMAAALAPSPLRLAAAVDAWNRTLPPEHAAKRFSPAIEVYRANEAAGAITFAGEMDSPDAWLLKQLGK